MAPKRSAADSNDEHPPSAKVTKKKPTHTKATRSATKKAKDDGEIQPGNDVQEEQAPSTTNCSNGQGEQKNQQASAATTSAQLSAHPSAMGRVVNNFTTLGSATSAPRETRPERAGSSGYGAADDAPRNANSNDVCNMGPVRPPNAQEELKQQQASATTTSAQLPPHIIAMGRAVNNFTTLGSATSAQGETRPERAGSSSYGAADNAPRSANSNGVRNMGLVHPPNAHSNAAPSAGGPGLNVSNSAARGCSPVSGAFGPVRIDSYAYAMSAVSGFLRTQVAAPTAQLEAIARVAIASWETWNEAFSHDIPGPTTKSFELFRNLNQHVQRAYTQYHRPYLSQEQTRDPTLIASQAIVHAVRTQTQIDERTAQSMAALVQANWTMWDMRSRRFLSPSTDSFQLFKDANERVQQAFEAVRIQNIMQQQLQQQLQRVRSSSAAPQTYAQNAAVSTSNTAPQIAGNVNQQAASSQNAGLPQQNRASQREEYDQEVSLARRSGHQGQ